jgi:hypothetical protein
MESALQIPVVLPETLILFMSGTRPWRLRSKSADKGLRRGAVKELRTLSEEYRERAAELRAIVQWIRMAENRVALMAMAEKYERLAGRLEQNAQNRGADYSPGSLSGPDGSPD